MWKEVICIEKFLDRLYVVKLGNELFRRNRQFLKFVVEFVLIEKQSIKFGLWELEVIYKENLKVFKLFL